MKKLLIGTLLSLTSLLMYAEIGVEVDPEKVGLGETFRLLLSQEDPQNAGIPNLTVLQKEFVIVGTERRISYSIINGQSQSSSQWVVTLKPKKTGTLIIPSISVGADQSKPSAIEVIAGESGSQDEALDAQNQDLLISAKINVEKAYINQQILYTVTLYNSKRLLDAEYEAPTVEDALMIPLGDTRRYKSVLNGINYSVEEQTYAIFPQKSGQLTVKSPQFTALLYDLNPKKISVKDKSIHINVLPIPENYNSSSWLPARKVTLSESYENNTQKLAQGSTLTRTVKIEGSAIPAQLLPNLELSNNEGFKAYPEKNKEQNQVIQGELISSKEIKITYLFNKPGQITIPEVSLKWFNIDSGEPEQAMLPPRSFDISSLHQVTDTSNESPLIQEEHNKSTPQSATSARPLNKGLLYLAIVLGLGWLITVLLWIISRSKKYLGNRDYNSALNELHKACKECNPGKARDALIHWAKRHWPDANILNLSDLARLARDSQFKKQVTLLSQVLYQTEHKALWRGDELWTAVQSLKPKAKSNKKGGALPPINPR